MRRLIDANALLDYFRNEQHESEVIEAVKDAPTVDAVEVVHGQWRKVYTCHGEQAWGYECDQCKTDNPRASYYCPNCGAKMDGERKDNGKSTSAE